MKRTQLIICCVVLCTLKINAQVEFVETSLERGLIFEYKESLKMGGGAASFDYDNDGDEDIYVVGGQNSDGLFQNDGFGNFTNVSLESNVALLTDAIMTTSVVTGDLDNDGYREIFVGTLGDADAGFSSVRTNLLLKYDPITSTYENVISSTQIDDATFCMGGHFFDSNQDGYLDLYLINYVQNPKLIVDAGQVVGFDHDCYTNSLYINNGDGTFTNQSELYGLNQIGCSLAATSSDLDWDGDPDIIVANDFGKWLQPNQLYLNQGADQPYVEIGAQSNTNAQMYGMGIAIGDYDEDLDLDFYVTNIGKNAFFENQGDMNFVDKADELDIHNTTTSNGLFTTGWGAMLEDFNNDTYLDLFVSNGYVYSAVDIDDEEQKDELYLGSSNKDFTNATSDCGIDFVGPSRGSLFGDWNEDGFLDLITITNENLTQFSQNSINYYENLISDANWIGLKLKGTESNSDAFGAKAILHAGDRAFMREIRGGDSHASQNSSILHFGLEEIAVVDSISLFWPSGITQIIYDLPINQYHTIIEERATFTTSLNPIERLKIYPNPTHQVVNIDFESDDIYPVKVKFYNSTGNLVLEQLLTNKRNKINIPQFPFGLYKVVCISETFYETRGIIINTP